MLYYSTGVIIYILVLTAVFGLAMGSFLNCMSWRIAHGEPFASGRSHCAVCSHPLSWTDLIPIVSYLLLKGCCRYCGGKISARYPLIEVLTATVFLSLVLRCGFSLYSLEFIILASLLLTVALVDLETFIIPDSFILLGIVNFVVFTFLTDANALPALKDGLINSLAITLPLLLLVLIADKLLQKESMGGGDIKLIFMIGLYFDWKCNLLLLMISCILGIVFALIASRGSACGDAQAPAQTQSHMQAHPAGLIYNEPATSPTKGEGDGAEPHTPHSTAEDTTADNDGATPLDPKAFPFGPSISAATWFVMLFGNTLIEMYLTLF